MAFDPANGIATRRPLSPCRQDAKKRGKTSSSLRRTIQSEKACKRRPFEPPKPPVFQIGKPHSKWPSGCGQRPAQGARTAAQPRAVTETLLRGCARVSFLRGRCLGSESRSGVVRSTTGLLLSARENRRQFAGPWRAAADEALNGFRLGNCRAGDADGQ